MVLFVLFFDLRMTWTSRSDLVPCCDGPHGAVRSEETIARLLHTRNIDAPIRKRDLFPSKPEEMSNECGNAGGLSVVRNLELSDEAVLKRSEGFAQVRANRTPLGASVASVDNLRNIRTVDNSYPSEKGRLPGFWRLGQALGSVT